MKAFLAIIIFTILNLSSTKEYLVIEHIGIIDKPIRTLYVSSEPIKIDTTTEWLYTKVKVSKKEFYEFKRVLELNLSNNENKRKGNDYGTFQIDIFEREKTSYVLTNEESKKLFKKIVLTENLNSKLKIEIENIIKRL